MVFATIKAANFIDILPRPPPKSSIYLSTPVICRHRRRELINPGGVTHSNRPKFNYRVLRRECQGGFDNERHA